VLGRTGDGRQPGAWSGAPTRGAGDTVSRPPQQPRSTSGKFLKATDALPTSLEAWRTATGWSVTIGVCSTTSNRAVLTVSRMLPLRPFRPLLFGVFLLLLVTVATTPDVSATFSASAANSGNSFGTDTLAAPRA
jgi:hypothetical protein